MERNGVRDIILVSACLAGIRCRYDGEHNEMDYIHQLVEKGEAMFICPEVLGGLSTPRNPAEIVGGSGKDVLEGKAKVVDITGIDVTDAFIEGAKKTLVIAQTVGAKLVVLKESSPSCGSTQIYNGSFNKTKRIGEGVTAALLRKNGIEVISEEQMYERQNSR